MALPAQSVGSSKPRRPLTELSDNVDSPSFSTRSKKSRSSVDTRVLEPKIGGIVDITITNASRKTGVNVNSESRKAIQNRQVLTDVVNTAQSPAFMTRSRKSRTEQRLADALSPKQCSTPNVVLSQESHLSSNWRRKKGSEEGKPSNSSKHEVPTSGGAKNILTVCNRSRGSSESAGSLRPSSIRNNDHAGSAVQNKENHTHIVSTPSDKSRASSVVSPSPDRIDVIGRATREAAISEVTPARPGSSSFTMSALRTPNHLVSAIGEGPSPNSGKAATEGKVRVYERRTSQQFERRSILPRSCPQLRGSSKSSTTRGAGFEHYSLRRLKDFSIPQKKADSSQRKTSSSSSHDSRMALPRSYCEEKSAYFREVDAFELEEEETDDDEEQEDFGKQEEK